MSVPCAQKRGSNEEAQEHEPFMFVAGGSEWSRQQFVDVGDEENAWSRPAHGSKQVEFAALCRRRRLIQRMMRRGGDHERRSLVEANERRQLAVREGERGRFMRADGKGNKVLQAGF